MIQRTSRNARIVAASDIQNEATDWLEDPEDVFAEDSEPVDVVSLVNVAVFLLEV